MRNRKATTADFLIAGFLFLLVLAVVVPFINTIAISFSTQREYLNTPLLLIPRKPTLNNYINLLRDKRISIGYLTSLKILLLGLPINLFLTVSLAYGTSRKNYPGKRLILGAILFTMLFNGGILPLYLQMRELHLTNTIWSVILASGINVFYFVLARNYFCSLPEALIESAQLDGAGEWKILFSIILPISKPILANVNISHHLVSDSIIVGGPQKCNSYLKISSAPGRRMDKFRHSLALENTRLWCLVEQTFLRSSIQGRFPVSTSLPAYGQRQRTHGE